MSLWRRAWRDKVLPAVVRHAPDLILLSAGFDAHRKDGMNHRFLGVQERDYEWLTAQIVQVRATARCAAAARHVANPEAEVAPLRLCNPSMACAGTAECVHHTCNM